MPEVILIYYWWKRKLIQPFGGAFDNISQNYICVYLLIHQSHF